MTTTGEQISARLPNCWPVPKKTQLAGTVALNQTVKVLKMREANVALVVARASRGRKPKMLFEEEGLFSKWHPGGRCFGPGVVVMLQSR
jgi:hypothetical protein